ncbi:hypothetical protein NQ318_001499, partial [Aromia moschata]
IQNGVVTFCSALQFGKQVSLLKFNVDNLVQRKPGQTLARKPFVDRSVNSKTPDAGKLMKQKQSIAKATTTLEKPDKSPKGDLNSEEFMFSYKDVEDTYDDIWPRLRRESLIKVLRNYCNNTNDTPPPSPEPAFENINPMFFELPAMEVPQLIDEDVWNPIYNVDMPECEDLDMSV